MAEETGVPAGGAGDEVIGHALGGDCIYGDNRETILTRRVTVWRTTRALYHTVSRHFNHRHSERERRNKTKQLKLNSIDHT